MTAHRIGLVLCSSAAKPMPSTRVAVVNMLPFMRSAGLDPRILFDPPQESETPDLTGVAKRAVEAGCQVVVLQKVHGAGSVALARELAVAGVSTVYAVCDWIDLHMVEATDATVVVTEYLSSLCPATLLSRIHVVHDGIERPEVYKSDWGSGVGSPVHPLQSVLVTSAALDRLPVLGHPPPWLKVRVVGRYASGLRRWSETRWKWATMPPGARLEYLRFLINHRIECVPWDREGVYREMMKSDIAIIPVETSAGEPAPGVPPAWKLKSENRLTMKMSMGLPVIATPIPSYEAVIEHGVNGFLARTNRDWQACLAALRDPDRRREMGLAARASVARKFSMQEQAAKLIRVLQESAHLRNFTHSRLLLQPEP